MLKKTACSVFFAILVLGLSVFAFAQTEVGFNSAHPVQYAASGSITVDGNLSEWTGADWIPFDTVYDGTDSKLANDIDGSAANAWTVKWGDGGKYIYVAIKIKDKNHVFTNGDVGWDKRDAIEIYINHPDSRANGYDATYQEWAQQWKMGVNADGISTWVSLFDVSLLPASYRAVHPTGSYVSTPEECVGAAHVDGDWIYYEAKVRSFQYFGGLKLQPSIPCPVVPGMYIGLDVCLVSAGPGTGDATYNGMMCSEEYYPNKSWDWHSFGQHLILPGPTQSVTSIIDARNAENGTTISITEGKAITAALDGAFYIEEDNRANGIKVISDYAAVVGDRVTVEGFINNVNGEIVIQNATVTPAAGTNIIKPLGAGNKSLTGNGLSMVGLLSKAWGKVGSAPSVAYIPSTITSDVVPSRGTDLGILSDGNLGGSSWWDGTYLGWNWNRLAHITFDLGEPKTIDGINFWAYGDTAAGIEVPTKTFIAYQKTDGTWTSWVEQIVTTSDERAGTGVRKITRSFTPFTAQSVMVVFTTTNKPNYFISEVQLTGHDFSAASSLTLDDGSGANLKVDLSRVTARPAAGQHVTVTGVCSVDQSGPIIIPRNDDDVSWKESAPASVK